MCLWSLKIQFNDEGIQQSSDSEAVVSAYCLVREVSHSSVLFLAEYEAVVFECGLQEGQGFDNTINSISVPPKLSPECLRY